MKKLFLFLSIVLLIGCSPEETVDCDCEAVLNYEFILTSWSNPDNFEDYERSEETGNYIGERREPVDCNTKVSDIDIEDTFGSMDDFSTLIIGGSEKVTLDCN